MADKEKEIIKALEKMKFGGHSCLECKHKKVKGDNRCGIKGCRIAQDALDLIYHKRAKIAVMSVENANLKMFCGEQTAEIERLKEENKKQKIILDGIEDAVHPLPFETDYDKAIKQAKSEAIREFADKVVHLICINLGVSNQGYRKLSSEIKDLVKEMVGDE